MFGKKPALLKIRSATRNCPIMKEKVEIVEELIEKGREYAKTNLELYKLKAIDKISDMFSSIAAGVTLAVLALFFIAMLTTGLALYLGELLGKPHHGFFAMAGLFFLLAVIVIIFRKVLVVRFFNNYIINQIFKDKDDASNNK